MEPADLDSLPNIHDAGSEFGFWVLEGYWLQAADDSETYDYGSLSGDHFRSLT